jgi:hypothetical protein
VSDEFTVPLCRTHHRELHRRGDERLWWQQLNIDPLLAASALWAQTHPALTEPEGSSAGKPAPDENWPEPTSEISGDIGGGFYETKPFIAADTP